jgi:hypothetical protein
VSPDGRVAQCVHDKCAFLFLVILISKKCVVIDSFSGRKLLINIGNFLLEITQAVPVSPDVVGDILIQRRYSGHAALKEGM